MKYIKWRHLDGDKRTPEQIRRDDIKMTWVLILFAISAVSFIMVVIFFILHYLEACAYCVLVFFISFSIALNMGIYTGLDWMTKNTPPERLGRGLNPWDPD